MTVKCKAVYREGPLPVKIVPARTVVPHWFTQLPKENGSGTAKDIIQNGMQPTAKTCVGLVDYFLSGYAMVLDCEIKITSEKDSGSLQQVYVAPADRETQIFFHHPSQLGKHGMNFGKPFCKIETNIAFKTPPKYSTLITKPTLDFDSEIEVVQGIVPTDVYEGPMNVFFTVKPDTADFTLKVGKVLAILHPFKRDEFVLEHDYTQPIASIKHNYFFNYLRKTYKSERASFK